MKSFQVETGRPEVRSGWKVSLDEEHRQLIKTLKRINGQVLSKKADIQANDNSGAFIIRVMFEAFADHYCEKASDSLYKKEIIPVDWHQRMENSEKEERYRLVADFISGMTDDYAKMIYDKVIETGSTCSGYAQRILFASHPAFRRFADLTGTPYRVYFTNRPELESWLLVRGWRQPDERWGLDSDSVCEYRGEEYYLKITHNIFDGDGNLIFNEKNWDDEWIQVKKLQTPPDVEPDDILF